MKNPGVAGVGSGEWLTHTGQRKKSIKNKPTHNQHFVNLEPLFHLRSGEIRNQPSLSFILKNWMSA